MRNEINAKAVRRLRCDCPGLWCVWCCGSHVELTINGMRRGMGGQLVLATGPGLY